MVKKKQIDVVTKSVEDKLDSNGALRNVAVKDAWLRLRQHMEVREWKKAESILKELSDNLQKINMLKSMSSSFSKLRLAFQNPDLLIEENDIATPRDTQHDDTRKSGDIEIDFQRAKYSMDILCKCMKEIKDKLDKSNDVPDKIDIPRDVSEEVKTCQQTLIALCDKFKKGTKEIEHLTKRLEKSESKNKDMETQIEEKDTEMAKLSQTVLTLEKKHEVVKETKMDDMKEQLKMKSLERQVEMKESEMIKLKQDNENLNKRMNEMLDDKSTEMADLYNPFPPEKLAEQFKDLFNTLWKEALDYYKTSLKSTEQKAAERLMNILSDTNNYCTENSMYQLERVTRELVCPGANNEVFHDVSKLEQSDVKQVENIRKQTCRFSCEFVKNSFITRLESANGESYTFDELTACMSYIERCVELCWYMSVQVPAMYIGFNDNTKQDIAVDKSKYEISSGKGAKVDFVMWPPLYRYKDGPLLCKGCIKTK
ncbi:hypothetical protein ACF0H5_011142 [Mactra antiquata]